LLPQVPHHFTSDYTTYIQPAAAKSNNPFHTSMNRARFQTPRAINTVEYIEKSNEEETLSDTSEDQDPIVQIEAIAYTIYKEIDRAKDTI
jgi:hypothetical protein